MTEKGVLSSQHYFISTLPVCKKLYQAAMLQVLLQIREIIVDITFTWKKIIPLSTVDDIIKRGNNQVK